MYDKDTIKNMERAIQTICKTAVTVWDRLEQTAAAICQHFGLEERVMEEYRSTMDAIRRLEIQTECAIFYAGYLSAEDNKSYLPRIVTSTLKSIVAESDHRQNRMLFKLAVELAVMMNVVAANSNIDPVSLERLRGECVKEVKRLNGSFTFDDAVSWQKGWEESE